MCRWIYDCLRRERADMGENYKKRPDDYEKRDRLYGKGQTARPPKAYDDHEENHENCPIDKEAVYVIYAYVIQDKIGDGIARARGRESDRV